MRLHPGIDEGAPGSLQVIGRLLLSAAKAVEALHTAPGGPILHSDLSSNQFLLDKNLQLRLNDFTKSEFLLCFRRDQKRCYVRLGEENPQSFFEEEEWSLSQSRRFTTAPCHDRGLFAALLAREIRNLGVVFAEVIQGHLKVRAEVWICAKKYEQNVQAPLWERVAATWGAPTLKPQLRGCVDPVPGLQQLVQTMCTPNDAHRPTATEVRRTLERLNFDGLQECMDK